MECALNGKQRGSDHSIANFIWRPWSAGVS